MDPVRLAGALSEALSNLPSELHGIVATYAVLTRKEKVSKVLADDRVWRHWMPPSLGPLAYVFLDNSGCVTLRGADSHAGRRVRKFSGWRTPSAQTLTAALLACDEDGWENRVNRIYEHEAHPAGVGVYFSPTSAIWFRLARDAMPIFNVGFREVIDRELLRACGREWNALVDEFLDQRLSSS